MDIKKINISHIEAIAHTLAKETMDWDEPIPPFKTRYPHKLESSIESPFMVSYSRELYPGLTRKAAVLFYLLIKNHPFENGNKRIAVTSLLVFLYLNSKWMKIDHQELYNFAKWIAASPANIMPTVVGSIDEFIGKYIIDLKTSQ